MSGEVAEAIRQTRRTPRAIICTRYPDAPPTCPCVLLCGDRTSFPRQTDVGTVLGMTLQALIAELCKPTLARRTPEA